MSRLRFRISMSLDGFIAGPNQSEDNPLGIGGDRLHECVNLVPSLLASGERLFDGVADLRGLELVRTVAAPTVMHLKFTKP